MSVQKNSFTIKQKYGSNKTMDAIIVSTITGPMTKKRVNLANYKGICKDLVMADDSLGRLFL